MAAQRFVGLTFSTLTIFYPLICVLVLLCVYLHSPWHGVAVKLACCLSPIVLWTATQLK